jgi:hypothetical protein
VTADGRKLTVDAPTGERRSIVQAKNTTVRLNIWRFIGVHHFPGDFGSAPDVKAGSIIVIIHSIIIKPSVLSGPGRGIPTRFSSTDGSASSGNNKDPEKMSSVPKKEVPRGDMVSGMMVAVNLINLTW